MSQLPDIDTYASLLPLDDDRLLEQNVPEQTIRRIHRIRGLYAYWIQFPTRSISEMVDYNQRMNGIKQSKAYEDVQLTMLLLGNIQQMTKDFARWRFNEMNRQHIDAAKRRGDYRAVASLEKNYIKANLLDKEDTPDLAYDQITPLQIIPTDDPSVLGLKKIPNLRGTIDKLIKKYTHETAPIYDEAEEIAYEELNDDTDD